MRKLVLLVPIIAAMASTSASALTPDSTARDWLDSSRQEQMDVAEDMTRRVNAHGSHYKVADIHACIATALKKPTPPKMLDSKLSEMAAFCMVLIDHK